MEQEKLREYMMQLVKDELRLRKEILDQKEDDQRQALIEQ